MSEQLPCGHPPEALDAYEDDDGEEHEFCWVCDEQSTRQAVVRLLPLRAMPPALRSELIAIGTQMIVAEYWRRQREREDAAATGASPAGRARRS